MSDAPHSHAQAKARTSERPAARTAERPAERPASRDLTEPIGDSIAAEETATKQSSGVELEEAIVTAGRAGERNITIEKFWVWVDGHLPGGFNVGTRPGHVLEVMLEQRSYRKSYSGTGSLKTGLMPIAPIGTKGRLVVTDVTTGETLEQPWVWYRIGGGGWGLWRAIKRLLWKG